MQTTSEKEIEMMKMNTLDTIDAKYCAGLMDRFANMGISQAAASSAIGNMIEKDAVPTSNICMATPSMFPSAVTASPEFAPSLAPSLS